MGSDPFITAVEGKKSPFLASTTVSRGSDPIKSTLTDVSGCEDARNHPPDSGNIED
jgi:hypothetical protein